MKKILFAFLLTITFLSCKKEQLLDVGDKTTGNSIRMNCEPFPMGLLTLNNGNISTSSLSMLGNVGYSRNLSNVINTNFFLNGYCYAHRNSGILNMLNTSLPGLYVQSNSVVDWKVDQANANAIMLSELYASWAGLIMGNINNSATINSASATTGRANTIIRINNVEMNGKILTLVGNPSSDDGFIFNVTGTNFSLTNSEIKLINIRPERVLFNFPNATNVQIKSGTKFRGTILSPTGLVTYQNPALYEGSIIAKKIIASGDPSKTSVPAFIQKTYCNGFEWENNQNIPIDTGSAPIMLVIDDESIDNGNAPNYFSAIDVNDQIAGIGLRQTLKYFQDNVGDTIDLFTGQVGDEGWFALKTIPESWKTVGPSTNGIRNFLAAGPGLGSGSDKEKYLDKIPNVTPLRAIGLKMLIGRTVLAVVYDGDVSINYSPLDGSLKGSNLGIVAFEVVNVEQLSGASSSSLPRVTIVIRDASQVASNGLELFQNAPVPISSSLPFDIVPPPYVSIAASVPAP